MAIAAHSRAVPVARRASPVRRPRRSSGACKARFAVKIGPEEAWQSPWNCPVPRTKRPEHRLHRVIGQRATTGEEAAAAIVGLQAQHLLFVLHPLLCRAGLDHEDHHSYLS